MTGDLYTGLWMVGALLLGLIIGGGLRILGEQRSERMLPPPPPDVPAIAAEKRAKYADALANLKPDDSLVYPDTDAELVRESRAAVKQPTVLESYSIVVYLTQYPPTAGAQHDTLAWTARTWVGRGEDIMVTGATLSLTLRLLARAVEARRGTSEIEVRR